MLGVKCVCAREATMAEYLWYVRISFQTKIKGQQLRWLTPTEMLKPETMPGFLEVRRFSDTL